LIVSIAAGIFFPFVLAGTLTFFLRKNCIMTSKGRRGQGKRTKQTKGKNIPAAIDTIKRDYQQVFSKLRENNTRAFSKAERVLQHIKALYDDPQLPSEFEVQVSDLYENINNDIEALNFVKKVGTTIKTAAQAEEENEKAHQTWVTVVNNRQTRQRTKLLPLLSAIERGNNVKRKSRSSVKVSKKKKKEYLIHLKNKVAHQKNSNRPKYQQRKQNCHIEHQIGQHCHQSQQRKQLDFLHH
jgi:hypothetical protein